MNFLVFLIKLVTAAALLIAPASAEPPETAPAPSETQEHAAPASAAGKEEPAPVSAEPKEEPAPVSVEPKEEPALSPVPLKAVPLAPEAVEPPVSPEPLKAVPLAPEAVEPPVSPEPLKAVPLVPETVETPVSPSPLPLVPLAPEAGEAPVSPVPLQAVPVAPGTLQVPPVSPDSLPVVSMAAPVNETARFLAGLPPERDPLLLELANERTWHRHSSQLNKAWAEFEKGRLDKVRAWSATHIPVAASANGTVFYMFSGPDFLYANAIYPGATSYVFCGVEPVGPIPDLTQVQRNRIPGELDTLRSSLDSVLSFSFFITKKMKKDLYGHSLQGALPIMCIFLAREDKTICNIEYVGIDKEGVLATISEPKRSESTTAPGVRITFRDANSPVLRTLYYFSTDISDSGLQSTGFVKFCQDLAPGNSLVKSASYLMHKSYFSTIRGFLLENTHTLVQDDSGIPISFFPPEDWELRLFGSYPGPIPLFQDHTQRKLHELYRDASPVPLDFGIGYRHRKGESMLIVARHRDEVPTNDAPRAVPVAVAPKEMPVKVLAEVTTVAAVPKEVVVAEAPKEVSVAAPKEVPAGKTERVVPPVPGAELAPAIGTVPVPQ